MDQYILYRQNKTTSYPIYKSQKNVIFKGKDPLKLKISVREIENKNLYSSKPNEKDHNKTSELAQIIPTIFTQKESEKEGLENISEEERAENKAFVLPESKIKINKPSGFSVPIDSRIDTSEDLEIMCSKCSRMIVVNDISMHSIKCFYNSKEKKPLESQDSPLKNANNSLLKLVECIKRSQVLQKIMLCKDFHSLLRKCKENKPILIQFNKIKKFNRRKENLCNQQFNLGQFIQILYKIYFAKTITLTLSHSNSLLRECQLATESDEVSEKNILSLRRSLSIIMELQSYYKRNLPVFLYLERCLRALQLKHAILSQYYRQRDEYSPADKYEGFFLPNKERFSKAKVEIGSASNLSRCKGSDLSFNTSTQKVSLDIALQDYNRTQQRDFYLLCTNLGRKYCSDEIKNKVIDKNKLFLYVLKNKIPQIKWENFISTVYQQCPPEFIDSKMQARYIAFQCQKKRGIPVPNHFNQILPEQSKCFPSIV